MHSALYSGWVRHRRYAPTAHEFQYRLFMMYLDLAELPERHRTLQLTHPVVLREKKKTAGTERARLARPRFIREE